MTCGPGTGLGAVGPDSAVGGKKVRVVGLDDESGPHEQPLPHPRVSRSYDGDFADAPPEKKKHARFARKGKPGCNGGWRGHPAS
jgi:hypothetical protein